MRFKYVRYLIPAFAMLISGCGASLPIMDLQHQGERKFSQFVRSIAEHVRCEMHKTVATEYNPNDPKRKILYDWAAKVALTIRALDKGTISPSLTGLVNAGRVPIAAGVSLETDGTREIVLTYYLPFNELLPARDAIDSQGRKLDCSHISGEVEPIAGNLGVDQTLAAALEAWDANGTLSDRIAGGPFETVTHHVIFQVVQSGNVTPSWKFTNITINPSGQLLSASRTRTDELQITMGPTQLGTRKELPGPSPALNQAFDIERLRSAVAQ